MCPNCDTPVRDASVICVRCGQPLRAMRVSRNLRPFFMGLTLVVMAVLVGAAWGLGLQG